MNLSFLLRAILLFLPRHWISLVATRITNLSYSILEESPEGTFVGDLGRDSDFDKLLPQPVVYDFYETRGSSNHYFRLDKYTGRLFVNSRIDRESILYNQGREGPCELLFSVRVLPDNWINGIVIIKDVNDHRPTFSDSQQILKFSEGSKPNSNIPLTGARDEDAPPNNIASYRISDTSNTFAVVYQASSALHLVLIGSLDYEKIPSYNLTLTACDDGKPTQLCGTQLLLIQVKDENDNKPEFQFPNPHSKTFNLSVLENVTVGSEILTVTAIDRDSGELGRLRYRISHSSASFIKKHFSMEEYTGKIVLRERFNARIISSFSFNVEVMDGGSPPLVAQAMVGITVIDVNDQRPVVKFVSPSGQQNPKLQVVENSPSGTYIGDVNASDDDLGDNGNVTCSIPQNNPYFELAPSNLGAKRFIYRLMTKSPVNREEQSTMLVEVLCRDRGDPPMHTTISQEIKVIDQNEYAPQFLQKNYSASIPENISLHKTFLNVRAVDEDAEAKLKYSLNVEGQQYFTINRNTGDISAAMALDRESTPKINFIVYVEDISTPKNFSASANVVVVLEDVNDDAPTLFGTKRFSILEGQGNQLIVGQLTASDSDIGMNREVRFRLEAVHVRNADGSLRAINANQTFLIRSTGSIVALENLDREKYEFYELTVLLHDMGVPSLSSTATILVEVVDINDNEPQWVWPKTNNQQDNLTGPIASHSKIATIRATDPDRNKNANVSYILLEGDQHVQLHGVTGDLYAIRELKSENIRLRFRAQDNGEPRLYTDRTWTLTIVPPHSWGVHGEGNTFKRLLQAFHPSYGIIIALLLGSFLIIALLLVTVLLIRRRNRRFIREKQLRKWVNENTYSDDVYHRGAYLGPPGPPPAAPPSSSTKHRLLASTPVSEKGYCDGQTLHVRSLMLASGAGGGNGVGACADLLEVNSADSGHGASEEEQPLNVEGKGYRGIYQTGGPGGGIAILGNPYPTLSEESGDTNSSSFLTMIPMNSGEMDSMCESSPNAGFSYHYNPMYLHRLQTSPVSSNTLYSRHPVNKGFLTPSGPQPPQSSAGNSTLLINNGSTHTVLQPNPSSFLPQPTYYPANVALSSVYGNGSIDRKTLSPPSHPTSAFHTPSKTEDVNFFNGVPTLLTPSNHYLDHGPVTNSN